MENKKNGKILLIIVAVFVLLMAGAYILYDQLSDSVERNNFVAQGGNSQSVSDQTASVENQTAADQTVSGSTDKTAGQTASDQAGTNSASDASGQSAADQSETNSASDTSGQTGSNSAPDSAADTTAAQLSLAPDFTVYDGDGNPVNLSDFIGKPVIVNFWASWCGPCKNEMPDFQELFIEYGDQIHFLMINSTDGSRETVETAKQFIADQGYTFPVYFDTDSSASITYGVSGIPMTFFIGAEGHAVAYAQGMLDRDTLQVGIDMIYTP